eukprot:jgi/Psemu1/31350/gm1.31350_g
MQGTGDSDVSLHTSKHRLYTGNSDNLHLQAARQFLLLRYRLLLLIRTSSGFPSYNAKVPTARSFSDHPHLHYPNMLTYTEYYQTTTSPLGVGPAWDLAYQTIYDYFAEETATPILLGCLLDLFEPEAVGAIGIFLTDTFGRARLQLVHGLR